MRSCLFPQVGSSAPEPDSRAEEKDCSTAADCTDSDINMVCRSAEEVYNLYQSNPQWKQFALSVSNEAASNTTKEGLDKGQMPGGREAKCKCRKDTRWSARALECQVTRRQHHDYAYISPSSCS